MIAATHHQFPSCSWQIFGCFVYFIIFFAITITKQIPKRFPTSNYGFTTLIVSKHLLILFLFKYDIYELFTIIFKHIDDSLSKSQGFLRYQFDAFHTMLSRSSCKCGIFLVDLQYISNHIYFCSCPSIRGISSTGICWVAADIGVWT